MSTIGSTVTSSLDKYRQDDTSVKVTTKEDQNKLRQEDFFALLTTQLSMQDPMKPTDNDQMIAQMTSFSMADGINNMSSKFDSFVESMNSSQALQASTLVGQKVLLDRPLTYKKAGEDTTGLVGMEYGASQLRVRIEDSRGQVIKEMPLGDYSAGSAKWSWDGTNTNGQPVADGIYKVKAIGLVNGKSVELPVQTHATVGSVTFGSGGQGLALNLVGLDSVSLTDVLAVGG